VRAPASNDFQAFDEHRNHDLTPTTFVPPLLEGSVPHGTGGADTTLDLITKEIAPYLEDRHALDPADRGIAGLSLSGLTTCWALLTRPNEFRRYLAVSPAIHWDYHLLLDETRLPAVPAPQAQVYLAVGENEEDHVREWPVAPPEAVELADSDMKMVSDTLSLADRLRRAGTDVRTEVIADENHQTVWPAAVTRGLIHLYQAHRFSGAGH
ncbi:MAG: alpha/beta hydrolase, partial [Kutzneria sp.]|nr:alpha/beta hydrolase [Kutzneria sp.]